MFLGESRKRNLKLIFKSLPLKWLVFDWCADASRQIADDPIVRWCHHAAALQDKYLRDVPCPKNKAKEIQIINLSCPDRFSFFWWRWFRWNSLAIIVEPIWWQEGGGHPPKVKGKMCTLKEIGRRCSLLFSFSEPVVYKILRGVHSKESVRVTEIFSESSQNLWDPHWFKFRVPLHSFLSRKSV